MDAQLNDRLTRNTLSQFMTEDIDKLIEACPTVASTWKAILIHAVDHAKSKGYKQISFSGLSFQNKGNDAYVTGHIWYS